METTNSNSLPFVQWGNHHISRMLVGHNPMKGQSHDNKRLDNEMKEWYDPAARKDVELLRQCEANGINTAQFGAATMHSLLARHREQGGNLQWIATFYAQPKQMPLEEELKQILSVNPRPIGIQLWGQPTDKAYFAKRMDEVHETIKMLRGTGLLVGMGTHLPETVAYAEEAGWDLDFYQTCFYSVYSDRQNAKTDRDNEKFEDTDRDRMVKFIKQSSKPCIAFKILGANRKCATDGDVKNAFRFAFENIKETDVVLVGMWQKHKDQVAQNAAIVREILEPATVVHQAAANQA